MAMEREFNNALHPSQWGNHLEYRNNGGHSKMNPEVQKLVDEGMSVRTAYRKAERLNADNKKNVEFNYERETPKGEWV